MAAESSNAAGDAKLWPDPIEKKFILYLLEEAINGNTPFDWQHVAKVLNEQSGKNHSLQQPKDKHKRLKMKYEAFSHPISKSDMKYDQISSALSYNSFTQTFQKINKRRVIDKQKVNISKKKLNK